MASDVARDMIGQAIEEFGPWRVGEDRLVCPKCNSHWLARERGHWQNCPYCGDVLHRNRSFEGLWWKEIQRVLAPYHKAGAAQPAGPADG